METNRLLASLKAFNGGVKLKGHERNENHIGGKTYLVCPAFILSKAHFSLLKLISLPVRKILWNHLIYWDEICCTLHPKHFE